jgi:hypothetical protein
MDGEYVDDHFAHSVLGRLVTGEPVPLTHLDRRRHLYVIGKIGTVEAIDAQTAIKEAIKKYAIKDPKKQKRLAAYRQS